MDPKTAPPELLGDLPGVGPGLAGRIGATREQAPFESPSDMNKRVPGIGVETMQNLRPYLRFPSDPASNPAGADRACGDLLNVRPPRLPGTTGAVLDGYSAQDAARDILAGLPRLSLSQPAPLPGLSSRDLPMELAKPPLALEEARREISDHLRHAISSGPGPSRSLGRDVGDPKHYRTEQNGLLSDDFAPARSVLSELAPPVESARRAHRNGLLSDYVTPARSVLSELAPPVESAQRAGGGIGDQVSVDLAAAAKDLREAAREFRQGARPGAAVGQPGPRGGGPQAPLPGIPPALPGRM
ncbi:MAG: ComEA family DNA-binding protein [Isosphaerales bacterium]